MTFDVSSPMPDITLALAILLAAGFILFGFAGATTNSLPVIFLSMAIGVITGLIIDGLMLRPRNRAEMLIGGLARLATLLARTIKPRPWRYKDRAAGSKAISHSPLITLAAKIMAAASRTYRNQKIIVS